MNERIEAPEFDGSAPTQAHSKSQYKRLVAQGANVLPPMSTTCNVNDDGVSDSVNEGNVLAGDALDAAIDAAMEKKT